MRYHYKKPDIFTSIYGKNYILHPKFKEFLNLVLENLKKEYNPTVTMRQIMWSLKMKSLKENHGKLALIEELYKREKNMFLYGNQ